MLLTKDGITVDVTHPVEIARLKALGYKAPEAPIEIVASEKAKTPEEANTDAITEANKPIGSKKKGGEK